jgi:hypothetical protein
MIDQNHQAMELRDYFAAKAMQTYLTFGEWGSNPVFLCEVAKQAYEAAEAMMKAREP